MLPSEHIAVSLLSVGSQRRPLEHCGGISLQPLQEHHATVLHLDTYHPDNFVDVDLVRQLFRSKYGEDAPIPPIDGDTRVHLQWHYLPLSETEVTKHRVVHNVSYQIILRKQDWERPVRLWRQQQYQQQQLEYQQQQQQQDEYQQQQQDEYQQQQHQPHPQSQTTGESSASEPSAPQPGVCRINTITGSESDVEPLDRRSTFTESVCSESMEDCMDEVVIVDDDDVYGEPTFEDDNEWLGTEPLLVETEDISDREDYDDADAKAYWSWSPTEQQWYHETEDGSIRWFPSLD